MMIDCTLGTIINCLLMSTENIDQIPEACNT